MHLRLGLTPPNRQASFHWIFGIVPRSPSFATKIIRQLLVPSPSAPSCFRRRTGVKPPDHPSENPGGGVAQIYGGEIRDWYTIELGTLVVSLHGCHPVSFEINDSSVAKKWTRVSNGLHQPVVMQ